MIHTRHSGPYALDPGHSYMLNNFDRDIHHDMFQPLDFVKRRNDSLNSYPGNANSYPGTTLQMVLRVVVNRIAYLNKQKPCLENWFIRLFLMLAIWLLEVRAARRHGFIYLHGLTFATTAPICVKCGHTQCAEENKP